MDTAHPHGDSMVFRLSLIQDMLALRRPGRPSSFMRLLGLVGLFALIIFGLSYLKGIEDSYLQLVESLMPDENEDVTVAITAQVTPLTSKPTISKNACLDNSGWVEEWIASGVMPRCSLAHRNTVDILYSYIPR